MTDTKGIYIGNQTSFSAPTTTYPFEYAIDRGFSAFEFFPDRGADGRGFAIEDLPLNTRKDLANLALAHSIRISVHAPWSVNPLHQGSIGRLAEVLRFAKDLGAVLINIHLYPEEGVAAFGKALAPFAQTVHQAGLQLALENTVDTPPELFNELFDQLEMHMGSAAACCGMCFDMGHANLQAGSRNDYLGYLDRLDPAVPITHVHLHENWGECDSHLTLFTGPSAGDPDGVEGLLRRLLRRGFSGSMILEQWPHPPELLDAAHDRLRAFLVSNRV